MNVGIYASLLLAILIRLWHMRRTRNVSWTSIQAKPFWSILVSILLYLLVYVIFRELSTGNYSGTDVSSFKPFEIASTLVLLSFGTIPLSVFSGIHSISNDPMDIKITGLASLSSINWTLLLLGAVFLALIVYCFYLLSRDLTPSRLQKLNYFLLFARVLLPNMLLSLTQRYQDWSLSYPLYLTTFNSHVFLSILIVACIARVIAGRTGLRVALLVLAFQFWH